MEQFNEYLALSDELNRDCLINPFFNHQADLAAEGING